MGALASDAESNPALLDANVWLVAQAATCQMGVGNKCSGICPGRQEGKRSKKPGPGRNPCACMR